MESSARPLVGARLQTDHYLIFEVFQVASLPAAHGPMQHAALYLPLLIRLQGTVMRFAGSGKSTVGVP